MSSTYQRKPDLIAVVRGKDGTERSLTLSETELAQWLAGLRALARQAAGSTSTPAPTASAPAAPTGEPATA